MIFLSIRLSTIVVGRISMVGIVFFASKNNIHKTTFYLISLASGTMLGSAFLHLIPEALVRNPSGTWIAVSSGVVMFFILEKFLIWRHCHLHQHPEDHTRPTAAKMVLVGDAIHNVIDGVIIASSFLASPAVGLSVTVAIILHEIPQELGDFGILIHGGYSMNRALAVNALTAMGAVLGAVLAYFFLAAMPAVQIYLLPVAAGGFLYIALADLIPQLHLQVALRQTVGQIVLLAVGFGLMILFKH